MCGSGGGTAKGGADTAGGGGAAKGGGAASGGTAAGGASIGRGGANRSPRLAAGRADGLGPDNFGSSSRLPHRMQKRAPSNISAWH